MLEWTLAHPWMTVFLIVCGYICVYYSVKQICWAVRVKAVCKGSKEKTIDENLLREAREDF